MLMGDGRVYCRHCMEVFYCSKECLELDEEQHRNKCKKAKAAFYEHKLKSKEFLSRDYRKTLDYWESKPATISGVLDGYEDLDGMDIEFSRKVLNKYLT